MPRSLRVPRFVQVAQTQLLSPLGPAQPSAVAWQPGSELPLVLPSLEGALHLVRGAPALSPTPHPILGTWWGSSPLHTPEQGRGTPSLKGRCAIVYVSMGPAPPSPGQFTVHQPISSHASPAGRAGDVKTMNTTSKTNDVLYGD